MEHLLLNNMPMTAVFLDRDGVIIEKAPEDEYIANWNEVRFLPGALVGISALYRAGFKIFIVTNQRGIALRKVLPENLDDIHNRMNAKFTEHGITITGIYFCPHEKSEKCFCRKPKPGMLLRAAEHHKLDLHGCWLVGDAPSDIEAGRQAGCKTIWIKRTNTHDNTIKPDLVAPDLQSAADQILQIERASSSQRSQGR